MKTVNFLTVLYYFLKTMYQLRGIVCKLLANFKKTKGRKTCDLCNRLIIKVPRTGIEPALPCDNQILSLARLPIPPSGHFRLYAPFLCHALSIKHFSLIGLQYYRITSNRPKSCQGIFSGSNTLLLATVLFR